MLKNIYKYLIGSKTLISDQMQNSEHNHINAKIYEDYVTHCRNL